MLTGRVAFAGDTVSDTIAKILEREPDWSALPAATPAPIRRLLLRCLAKDPKQRLRDIGDVRIEIDAIDEVLPGATATPVPLARARTSHDVAAVGRARRARRGRRRVGGPAPGDRSEENPLANAQFSRFTDWEGTEEHAEISPDGRFVAFLADRDGQFDLWVSQVGTGNFRNLTPDIPPLMRPGISCEASAFQATASEIWFSPRRATRAREKVLMPLTGGTPRPFLGEGQSTPSWSPDDTRLAYLPHRTAPAIPCRSPTARARTRGRSSCRPRQGRFSGRACTTTIRSGHRMASGSTSCTGRTRPKRWTCGAIRPSGEHAGATDAPERSR